MQFSGQVGGQGNFFDEIRFWSRIKLRILEKYLDAYVKKRGGSHPKIYFVDGFAGPGYYGKEGFPLEEGSPVRLARFAQKIKTDGRGYRLICVNTERNKQRCKILHAALAGYDSNLVHVLCGTLQQNLPTILDMMQHDPAVCFLDPFGVVGVSPEDLRPLLERPDTELLLNFNTRVLHRLSGSATSDAKEAQGKVKRLSRTLGENPEVQCPEWLKKRKNLSSQVWEKWAVNQYRQQLHNISPHLKYGLAYPIRELHGKSAKYHLVFASRSLHAFPLMSDIICSEEDDLRLKTEISSRVPGQMSLFGPVHETERERRLAALIDEIHGFGMSHQGCNRKRIIEEFSYLYLGELKQKHYRQILDKLVSDGRAAFGKGEKHTAPITFC